VKAKKAVKSPAKKPAKKLAAKKVVAKAARKSPKTAVKKSTKAAPKKPAKTIAKVAAKKLVKKAAKPVVKKATKKPAKSPAKAAAKKLIKKVSAAKPVRKPAPKKLAGKATKKTVAKKPGAKKPAAKKPAKKIASKPAPQNIQAAPTKVYDGPPWPLMEAIVEALETAKAESILPINVEGRSSVADGMVIATGRVNRHVAAIAEQLIEKLKSIGQRDIRVEGLDQGDWVLVDAGNVIVHIFRPEVRAFYNLEKLWSEHAPAEKRED
jgi:ribosome-associated protein